MMLLMYEQPPVKLNEVDSEDVEEDERGQARNRRLRTEPPEPEAQTSYRCFLAFLQRPHSSFEVVSCKISD